VIGLLGANALMLVTGLGLVGLRRAAVAYLAGIALCGSLAAELAVVGVAYGWTLLALTTAAAVAFRLERLRRSRGAVRLSRPSAAALVAVALLVALFVRARPAFRVRPLDEYDGWAMWAMKGHALELFGWADPKLFAEPSIALLHLDYPLFLPALEAVGFRAAGGFDPQLMHIQFLLFGAAGVAAIAWVLRGLAPAWVVWSAVVAIAAAPNVLLRLPTAYADIPLALLAAAGLAALARWLRTRERFLLALATLLFAAAALTKNEALLFVGAAYVAALATDLRRWRPLVASAVVVELALLPWQIYGKLEGIHSDSAISAGVRLDNVHPGVIPIAFRRLVEESFSVRHWALLGPLFLLALAVAALRRSPLALFASVWALLSLCALTWIYVASPNEYSQYLDSSADRVVSTLVLGAAALVPGLVGRGHYASSDAGG
jgi:hypothetical protein